MRESSTTIQPVTIELIKELRARHLNIEAKKLLETYQQNKAEAKIQIMVENGYKNQEITREAYKILNRCIECGAKVGPQRRGRKYVRCLQHRQKNNERRERYRAKKRNTQKKKPEKTLAEEIMQ